MARNEKWRSILRFLPSFFTYDRNKRPVVKDRQNMVISRARSLGSMVERGTEDGELEFLNPPGVLVHPFLRLSSSSLPSKKYWLPNLENQFFAQFVLP